jgi:hypothetical protein
MKYCHISAEASRQLLRDSLPHTRSSFYSRDCILWWGFRYVHRAHVSLLNSGDSYCASAGHVPTARSVLPIALHVLCRRRRQMIKGTTSIRLTELEMLARDNRCGSVECNSFLFWHWYITKAKNAMPTFAFYPVIIMYTIWKVCSPLTIRPKMMLYPYQP